MFPFPRDLRFRAKSISLSLETSSYHLGVRYILLSCSTYLSYVNLRCCLLASSTDVHVRPVIFMIPQFLGHILTTMPFVHIGLLCGTAPSNCTRIRTACSEETDTRVACLDDTMRINRSDDGRMSILTRPSSKNMKKSLPILSKDAVENIDDASVDILLSGSRE